MSKICKHKIYRKTPARGSPFSNKAAVPLPSHLSKRYSGAVVFLLVFVNIWNKSVFRKFTDQKTQNVIGNLPLRLSNRYMKTQNMLSLNLTLEKSLAPFHCHCYWICICICLNMMSSSDTGLGIVSKFCR